VAAPCNVCCVCHQLSERLLTCCVLYVQLETEAVYRAVMLASSANAPVYVTKVMSRSSADVIADSRRSGKISPVCVAKYEVIQVTCCHVTAPRNRT